MAYGLYVHVPFCAHRCPYCSFVLVESDGSRHAAFVKAVAARMRAEAPRVARTLYLGGGTPSMLEPEQVAGVAGAAAHHRWEPGREFTLEANPDGLGLDRLKGFREAGVTRLTLGVQSLDPDALRFLGRTHEPRMALESYHAARAAGFRNVCVDLIFGWPGQTVESWSAELRRWSKEGAEHVSIYGLTVEKGTELARRVGEGLALPGEGPQRDLYVAAMDVLGSEGYRQYELSNFAKPGFESIHNSGYWDGRPYLGYGPGAHSYEPPRRRAEISNVEEYLRRAAAGEDTGGPVEELTADQRMLERIFLGLRRSEGVFVPDFEAEFGVVFRERYRTALDRIEQGALVEWRGGFVRLTRAGKLLADSVVGQFA